MMREVALPDDPKYLRRYPHELSGGQQQRVGLAMAFACRPRLIVLDEPTTGLDVTTQAHVLNTVRDLAAAHRVGGAVRQPRPGGGVDPGRAGGRDVRRPAGRGGRLVRGALRQRRAPVHPAAGRGAIPRLAGSRELVGIPGRAPSPGSRPSGLRVRTPLRIRRGRAASWSCRRCWHSTPATWCAASGPTRCGPIAMPFAGEAIAVAPPHGDSVLSVQQLSAGYRGVTVLHDINLELAPQECLALVGESGSGKTTLARSIAGLHRERPGEIVLHGERLAELAAHRSRRVPPPASSTSSRTRTARSIPRRTIGQIVRQPLEVFGIGGQRGDQRVGRDARARVADRRLRPRYPDQLSGGERQRVAIARALVSRPGCADLRRGHLRARRQRPGGDRRAAGRAAARPRPGDAVRHPQPAAGALDRAAGGGHERRADRRAGRRRARCCSSPATTTPSGCCPTRRRSRPSRRELSAGRPSRGRSRPGSSLFGTRSSGTSWNVADGRVRAGGDRGRA